MSSASAVWGSLVSEGALVCFTVSGDGDDYWSHQSNVALIALAKHSLTSSRNYSARFRVPACFGFLKGSGAAVGGESRQAVLGSEWLAMQSFT